MGNSFSFSSFAISPMTDAGIHLAVTQNKSKSIEERREVYGCVLPLRIFYSPAALQYTFFESIDMLPFCALHME